MIYRLTSLQSLGVETVEGIACDHLVGEDPKYGRYEFWIGRDDHMLRKIESAVAGAKFEEIRKDVRVNAEVPASVFQSEN